MTYWITDRVPTEKDADADGDVVVCANRQGSLIFTFRDWNAIRLGEPWLPFIPPLITEQSSFATTAAAATQPPTPCLVQRRFVSLISHNSALIAVADDGTAWFQLDSASDWHPLRALPPR
jgi:hypothetical protein